MRQKSASAETGAPGWRYKAGLSLFVLAVVSPAVAPLVAFTELSTEWKAIIADFVFLASFFVLGGDFWDKIRALFVYGAKAQFPERTG